jgi:hypothetical protein
MYGSSHASVSAPMNGIGGDLVDGSGTINPAALNNTNNGMWFPSHRIASHPIPSHPVALQSSFPPSPSSPPLSRHPFRHIPLGRRVGYVLLLCLFFFLFRCDGQHIHPHLHSMSLSNSLISPIQYFLIVISHLSVRDRKAWSRSRVETPLHSSLLSFLSVC